MTDVSIAVLSLGCAVLCVAVAGLLRRITDVKLRLGGYNGEIDQFMIDIGRMLPEPVVAEIPDPSSAALLIVASRSCEVCHQLVEQLDSLPGQVLVGVMSGEGADLDTEAQLLLSERATDELVNELGLSQIPVAIVQRDSFIVGAAYGDPLVDPGGLEKFWMNIIDQPVEVPA